MHRSTKTRVRAHQHHMRSAKPSLDPYVIDEITFTRDEILRARSRC